MDGPRGGRKRRRRGRRPGSSVSQPERMVTVDPTRARAMQGSVPPATGTPRTGGGTSAMNLDQEVEWWEEAESDGATAAAPLAGGHDLRRPPQQRPAEGRAQRGPGAPGQRHPQGHGRSQAQGVSSGPPPPTNTATAGAAAFGFGAPFQAPVRHFIAQSSQDVRQAQPHQGRDREPVYSDFQPQQHAQPQAQAQWQAAHPSPPINTPQTQAQVQGKGRRRGRGKGPAAPQPQPAIQFGAAPPAPSSHAPARPQGQPQSQTLTQPHLHANARTSSTTQSQMTTDRFDALPIHASLVRAITVGMGYSTMTRVQAESIPVCLTGADVLAKAKTGTGKTLSFLIPTIHRINAMALAGAGVAASASGAGSGRKGRKGPMHDPSGVRALVISPTRELARQIEDEATLLAKFLNPPLAIQCVVGGTKVNADIRTFIRRAPDVLIATPGRLVDLLENHGLTALAQGLAVLVFDEADQLLDMGFRPEIERVLRCLGPASARQTLLFSATMPEDVQSIARVAMSDHFEHVDTVGAQEQATHQHVPQHLLITPIEAQFAELLHLLQQAQSSAQRAKVIVFFTTARLTQFYAALYGKMGIPVLEIHSRKSQSHRTRVSEQFRTMCPAVLFTSDVSARGMDYPDVTHVIQVGLPADRAQYIHRLGRTAHSPETQGQGILLLGEFERGFVQKVRDLPLTVRGATDDRVLQPLMQFVDTHLVNLSPSMYGMAYQSSMGFYNSNLKLLRWQKADLVAHMNDWIVRVCRAPTVPGLLAQTVGKMGLKGVPGLVIERKRQRGQQGGAGAGTGTGTGAAAGGMMTIDPPQHHAGWQTQSQHPEGGAGGGGQGRGRGGNGGRGRGRRRQRQ